MENSRFEQEFTKNEEMIVIIDPMYDKALVYKGSQLKRESVSGEAEPIELIVRHPIIE